MRQANRNFVRIFLLGLCVFAVLLFVGPLESKFFPVTDNYTIRSEAAAGNDLAVRLTFTKKRDCEFISGQIYIYFDDNTSDRFFLKDDQSFTRPEGNFSVNWTILGAAQFIGHKMEFVTEHHCWGSLFWSTRTTHLIARDFSEEKP